MGLDAMERLGLGLGHHLMGHRQLLNVVDPVLQRVVVGLSCPDPQHVQDDLGVLGIILVPAVVQRLPGPSQSHRGDQPDVEAGLHQPPGEWAVVVPGRLQADGHRALQGVQLGDQPVVLGTGVGHRHPAAPPGIGHLDQHLVPELGDINGDKDCSSGCRLGLGHGRSAPLRVAGHHHCGGLLAGRGRL